MALPSLSSPPTNCWGLYQYLAQRLPGYDPSEYLREINSGYIHVWEEISKLRNQYFSQTLTVSVVTAQTTYDLAYNTDNALSNAISPRLYTILRVRVQPPSGAFLQTSSANGPNDPDFLSVSANPSAQPTQTGPYYWYLIGHNSICFALPLAVGSNIEVTYVMWPIALVFLYGGTVSSAGTVVTGNGTNFTQLVQPDFQYALPSQGTSQEILQAELVCAGANNNGQVYRVGIVNSDILLNTLNPIVPALPSSSPYVLATLPEIPREHIRVIASVAMQKMYSVDGDDARSAEWMGIAEKNLQMCKDSLIERQANNPPKKQRFPGSIGRKNRLFMR
jgi:hypothetical protein